MTIEGSNLFMWLVGAFALGCVIYCIFKDAKSVRNSHRNASSPVSDRSFHKRGINK